MTMRFEEEGMKGQVMKIRRQRYVVAGTIEKANEMLAKIGEIRPCGNGAYTRVEDARAIGVVPAASPSDPSVVYVEMTVQYLPIAPL